MKRVISKICLPLIALTLSGCAFFEFKDNEKLVVDMGDGDSYITWSLVENNNEYRPIQEAHFEINKTNFKYYEDGELKKQGDVRSVYHGLDHTTRPLTIRLSFGYSDNLEQYDELICFTEDEKESLHQFTIMAEGYHIKPLRGGGVPIRDYHLSDMPYAFGTYVKDGTERKAYQNKNSGKVTESVKLNETFTDESENKFYFLNNCYFNVEGYYFTSSRIYFRYENNIKDISIEGTISLTWVDSYAYGRRVDYALLRIMHGEDEPSEQRGVVMDPDYHLVDFVFSDENTFSFTKGEYFYENRECPWDPNDFIPGTYRKSNVD